MTGSVSENSRVLSSCSIESALIPETAIEIISEKECNAGLEILQRKFSKIFPNPHQVSVVPIFRSGERLGRELTEPLGIEINPMQMAYTTGDTGRLPKPICLLYPDINKIVTPSFQTLPVAFAECVVDTQGTLMESINIINAMIDKLALKTGKRLDCPEYYTFAYVSKTGDNQVIIPNLVAAFKVNPDIWVGGRGCDLPGDIGREFPNIVGILSKFAKQIPQHPYYNLV